MRANELSVSSHVDWGHSDKLPRKVVDHRIHFAKYTSQIPDFGRAIGAQGLFLNE